jgi:Protein of unknown function (DUF669)
MDFTRALDSTNSKSAEGLAGFDAAESAPEFAPIPPGTYAARIVRGEYCSTKAGNDAYRMRFEVTEGEQTGRTIVRTWTFGPKALPYTKRDLAPFGLTSSAALLAPFPPVGKDYRVRLVVVLQRGNDGREFIDIKCIDVLRVDESPAAAFLLLPPSEGGPK